MPDIDRIMADATERAFAGRGLGRAIRKVLEDAGYVIVPATDALLEKGKQDIPSGKVR